MNYDYVPRRNNVFSISEFEEDIYDIFLSIDLPLFEKLG
jgi:hypothetical protein